MLVQNLLEPAHKSKAIVASHGLLGFMEITIPIEALALIGSFNPSLNGFGLSCVGAAARLTEATLWTRTVDKQVQLANLESCGIGTITFGDFFNQSLKGVNLACSVHTFKFGFEFNQCVQGVNWPAYLQTLMQFENIALCLCLSVLSLCLCLALRKSHVLVSLHMLVISVCGFRSRLVTPLEFFMKEPEGFWFPNKHNMLVFV